MRYNGVDTKYRRGAPVCKLWRFECGNIHVHDRCFIKYFQTMYRNPAVKAVKEGRRRKRKEQKIGAFSKRSAKTAAKRAKSQGVEYIILTDYHTLNTMLL